MTQNDTIFLEKILIKLKSKSDNLIKAHNLVCEHCFLSITVKSKKTV